MKVARLLLLLLPLVGAGGCKKEEATTLAPTPVNKPEKKLRTFAPLNNVDKTTLQTRTTGCPDLANNVVCVTLLFTGIAHLVGEDTDPARLLVVPDKTGIKHEPLILTKGPFYAGADSMLTKEHLKPDGSIEYNYDAFNPGVEIDLKASGATNLQPLDFDPDGDPKVPCPEENFGGVTIPKESLYWLPRLPRVSKHGGAKPTLKARLTGPNPTGGVVTRLQITSGRIFSVFSGGVTGKYQFERNGPASDDHVQAVGSYLAYKFPAKLQTHNGQKLFILAGRKFGGGTATSPIARFKEDGGEVMVTIANVVPDAFFRGDTSDEIAHFDEYYDIYDTNAPKKTKPKRKKESNGNIDSCAFKPGASGVECGPSQP